MLLLVAVRKYQITLHVVPLLLSEMQARINPEGRWLLNPFNLIHVAICIEILSYV